MIFIIHIASKDLIAKIIISANHRKPGKQIILMGKRLKHFAKEKIQKANEH